MRRKATCELVGAFSDETVMRGPFGEKRIREVGVMVDDASNLSEPIKMPTPIDDIVLIQRIESCTQPQPTFWSKIFKRSNAVYCPAVSDLKLDSKAASNRMMVLIRLSLIEEGTSVRRIFNSSRFRQFQ